MTVTILGSGAAEGIPAFLCQCRVCIHARHARGMEIRQNTLALITSVSGPSLLIDVPPHFKATWDQGQFREDALAAVLVTHAHDDHSLGLPYLWDAVFHDPDREVNPLPIHMPADVFDLRVRPLLEAPANPSGPRRLVRPVVAQAYREFTAGPFTVTPLETDHLGGFSARGESPHDPAGCREDFGYLVEDSDGTRVAYLLDVPATLPGPTMERLAASRLDCLVCECTYAACGPDEGHLDVPRLRELATKLAPQISVATHIGHGNDSHRGLSRALRPDGIRVAFDGMTVQV